LGKEHRTDRSDPSDPSDSQPYSPWLHHPGPAVVANTVLCLIHQANYLLDRQLGALERQFVHDGGYSERLAAARLEERRKQTSPDPIEEKPPACLRCGKAMVLRTAHKGPRSGSRFWGCSAYPACKGVLAIEESDGSV
jgi:four helix bundle suffix protein